MKVSEAIGKLKIGDTVWVKGEVLEKDRTGSPLQIEFVGFTKWITLFEEISLSEPQGEKVEVPDFIAKLIRKYKAKKETLVCSIANLNRQSDEYKWYVDNAEIYERAWVNGYTVKPKQWVVKKGKDCVLTSFTFFDEQSVNYDSNSYGKDYLIFTDKSKAEAVATLVEGSVEEEQK